VKSDAILDEVSTVLIAQILENASARSGRCARTGKLRRVLVRLLGGGASRVRDVVDHVGPGRDLHVEQTLACLVASDASENAACFA